MTGRARSAVLVLIVCGLGLSPGSARAGWTRPFALTPPGTLDRLPARLAIAPSGGAAAAFSILDVDTPGSAQAYLVQRSPPGTVGSPRAIGGAREILALSYSSRGLQLLTGGSPAGLDCCSTVGVARLGAQGVLSGAQTLAGGLTGATLGGLVPLAHGRQLAAIASERGVWVAESGAGGRFGTPRRLTGAAESPQALSAAPLDGENAVVAWTAATGPAGSADPRSIFYALASHRSPPHAAQTLLRTPAGHRIEELVVAGRAKRATAAWIDSSFDPRGGYRAQVRAADFAAHPNVRDFAAPGSISAGLSLAADPAGAQALVYETCRADGGCTVWATTRGPASPFATVTGLGSIDPGQTPALSESRSGRVIVGWIRGGHPVAAVGAAGHGRFGAVRSLSPTVYGYDIAVADGPRGGLAAWTQGTLHPSLVAAGYH